MSIYTYIFTLWIVAFGFIIYNRTKSNSIILICVCMITYLLIYMNNTNQNKINKKNIHAQIVPWINQLKTAKNQDEIDRCYNIIRNYLFSNALSSPGDSDLMDIHNMIGKYKPITPYASNIDKAEPYDISVGFRK